MVAVRHSTQYQFAVRGTLQVTREAHFQVAREGPLGAIHEVGAMACVA